MQVRPKVITDTMDICCTLVSGTYFLGASALINSLSAHGFQGEFHVGYTGPLPSWWERETQDLGAEITVVSIALETPRHLGYEKPAFLHSIFENNPQCQRLFWFDADMVVTAPWSFVQKCVDAGLVVCSDVGFAAIWPLHPWRKEWRQLIQLAGLEEGNPQSHVYPNSGFVGCHVANALILRFWAELVVAFEKTGGNTRDFVMAERWHAVVGDQDLLSAALMCWDGPLLCLGPEAMGFNGLAFPFCHGVESPKIWQMGALARALSGNPLTPYRRFFEDNIQRGPVQPFSRPVLLARLIELKAAILLSRFYKK